MLRNLNVVIRGIVITTFTILVFSCVRVNRVCGSPDSMMEVQNVLFAFGWSKDLTDWRVNNETYLLNNKCLVLPPQLEDAGPLQINPSIIHLNNVGFHQTWSQNSGEKYSPSDSMLVGAEVPVDSRGLTIPPATPVNGSAGSSQTNSFSIYLNNINFHSGWSSNTDDSYSPSNSMLAGDAIALNDKALISPSQMEDAGSLQHDEIIIHLNNMGFYYGWTPNPEDRYRPSGTITIGPLTPLNTNGLKEAPPEIVIPEFPSFLIVPLFMIAVLLMILHCRKSRVLR